MPAMPAQPVPGQPVWAELFTLDAERARAFYPAILGWGCTEPNPDFGGYANFTHGGGWIAGVMGNTFDPSLPSAWTVYLHTDDVHATVQRARDAGAPVIVEPAQVGELGWFAQVVDPSGAAVGAWQPAAHRGFAAVREAGAPYWFELHAAQGYEAALAFYRDVFGCTLSTMSDVPEFRYTQVVRPDAGAEIAPEDALAGVMDASGWPGAVSAWQVYWMVGDVEASVAACATAGAQVIDAPHETPYGRLATLRDPTGAAFKLAEALVAS